MSDPSRASGLRPPAGRPLRPSATPGGPAEVQPVGRAPDGPGDAAGPHGVDIGPGDLREAMRVSRSTFYDARKRGQIPAPDRSTPGGHGRYSPDLAAEIVRKSGHEVPASWGAQPAPAAGGGK